MIVKTYVFQSVSDVSAQMGSQGVAYAMDMVQFFASRVFSQFAQQMSCYDGDQSNIGHRLGVRWSGTMTPIDDYDRALFFPQEFVSHFVKLPYKMHSLTAFNNCEK